MKKNNYSAKLRKSLNTEHKNIDIIEVLCNKDKCTKKDLRLLTGIPNRDMDLIFAEDGVPGGGRGIKCDFFATCALSNYSDAQYEGFAPHQRVVTELIWKWVKGEAIMMFAQQYTHITGRFLEDDFIYEDVFQVDTFEISEDELDEVADVVKMHIAEVSENQNSANA